MSHFKQAFYLIVLGAALAGIMGCATIDRLGSTMDMAAARLATPGHLEYEGRLEALEPFGSMVAIQFAGGKYYDVVHAAPGLVHGDVVRIYKTKKGYEAHLWRRVQDQPVAVEIPAKEARSTTRS